MVGFSPVRYASSLFAYAAIRARTHAQKHGGPSRCDIFGTYMVVIMFTFFVLGVPQTSTRRAVEKKLFFNSRKYIAQIRYTTYAHAYLR